jgi:hypothetical protein
LHQLGPAGIIASDEMLGELLCQEGLPRTRRPEEDDLMAVLKEIANSCRVARGMLTDLANPSVIDGSFGTISGGGGFLSSSSRSSPTSPLT